MNLLSFLPNAQPGVVSLLAGGMVYEHFTQVEVTRSVKEMAGKFSLHVSDRFSGGLNGPSYNQTRAIREGDPCQIFYSGIPVLAGHVDAVNPRYSKKQHSVSIHGRSKTGDLCDSSVDEEIPGGEMRDVTLDQVARKASGNFGVGVKVEADVKDRFDQVRVQPGETVHRFLERYARPGAVSLTDDQMGNLRLFQAKGGGVVATLIEGVDIEEASAMLRMDGRHSKYTAKGQDRGSDREYGKPVAQRRAKAKDGAVKRHRPLTLLNETKTSKPNAKNRAAWEASQRAGESCRAEVKLTGWGPGPGSIWMPGDNVMLISPMLYVERILTVQNVVLTQSRSGGTIAKLALVPPEAINPAPAAKGASGAGAGNDGAWNATKPEEWPMP